MAEEFGLEAAGLLRVSEGLRDIESRMAAVMLGLRGQLAGVGAPWQFSGGPGGVGASLEDAQGSVDPSMTRVVAGLADDVQAIVTSFRESDG